MLISFFQLTDAGITGIDLPECAIAIWDLQMSFSVADLKRLRILNLSGCYRVTDFSFRMKFQLQELRELILNRLQVLIVSYRYDYVTTLKPSSLPDIGSRSGEARRQLSFAGNYRFQRVSKRKRSLLGNPREELHSFDHP